MLDNLTTFFLHNRASVASFSPEQTFFYFKEKTMKREPIKQQEQDNVTARGMQAAVVTRVSNSSTPPIEHAPPNAIQVGAGGKLEAPRENHKADLDDAAKIDVNSPQAPQAGTALGTGIVPDPFDPANLRLSQNFLNIGGVKKHLTTVPTRKPTKEEFVRVHPGAEYALDTLVLELKDSRECFVIAPALWAELATESTVNPRRLHTAISRQGTLFLWPVRLPKEDGRFDNWGESALEIIEAAKTDWVRVQSDMGVGAYVYSIPLTEQPPPVWPDMTFQEILRLAFRNYYIDAPDHPVLRRLRGEV